ncbi:MAG TPA: hypothetical protein VNL17_03800 [Verrucomicrobiae bacterium]|nr:hypothetical protein [Verrucomicrobiae bacterium]
MANRSGKPSFLGHWHTIMWGAIGCLFCWAIVPSAPDQRSGSLSTLAFLSVPTITTESIRSYTSEQIKPQTLTLCVAQPMQIPPPDSGSWKRYDPDTRVVAANRFPENPDTNADINSEQKSQHYLGTNSPTEPDDPHVKLGLDQEEAGKKPRLALRFIIPFGN